MPRKRTKSKKNNEINLKLIDEKYYEIDSVVSSLTDVLTELQSIGLPQEVIDETENKILDAISEAESLREGIF